MSKYLMQAVSGGGGGDGTLKAWSAGAADWAAAGFPGPGTAQYVAIRKVIRDDVLVTAGNGTEVGRRIEWTGSIWAQRRGWITPDVDLTGVTDASAAINAALAVRVGACVFLPDGKIRWNSTITVPAGTTLCGSARGMGLGPFAFNDATATAGRTGSMCLVYGTGIGISLGQQSRVCDLEFFYPDQEVNATPDVYDYLISAPANSHTTTIENIVAVNPYRFIRIGQPTTPYAANGCRIDNVWGYPLSVGINLGRCADVARISNVSFNPGIHYNFGATLKAWVQANGTAFLVDGAEEFAFNAAFAYGYNLGLRFVDLDGDGFRGVYGSWTGGGLDICNACIYVDEPNGLTLRGLKISNCGLVPNGASANGVLFVDTRAAANADERPAIYASNVSFWNTMSRGVYLVNGSRGIYQQFGGSLRGHTNEGFRVEGANARIHLDGVGVDGGTRSAAASSGVLVDVNTWDP